MLLQANMPDCFWAEAMSTTVYLINWLPSSAIDDQIPFECWYERDLKETDIKLLRPFGCIVWDNIPKQRRGKLSKFKATGTRGCFVGYVSSTTYKYWNFERKTFLESHDLTFMETEFPTHEDFNETLLDAGKDSEESDGEKSISEGPDLTLYDEIIVEPPPVGIVFSTLGPIQDSEPVSFQDAKSRPDWSLWWNAMVKEIEAIIQNQTWELTDLPQGKRVIPLKWVFKIKRDAQGNFDKYKARIVVRGYSQIAGLDFEETFAPVIRIESVRLLLAIAAANDLYILQIDCKNAFLHGKNDMDIFVHQPEGFVDVRSPDKVLCLNKSLYGLKQAP
jgi:hypothetical protein